MLHHRFEYKFVCIVEHHKLDWCGGRLLAINDILFSKSFSADERKIAGLSASSDGAAIVSNGSAVDMGTKHFCGLSSIFPTYFVSFRYRICFAHNYFMSDIGAGSSPGHHILLEKS